MRTVTLTRPFYPHCFRAEWGSLVCASAVYCDCREDRKVLRLCIKTYPASVLCHTRNPKNSDEVSALSLAQSPIISPLSSKPLIPVPLSQPIPLAPASAFCPIESPRWQLRNISYPPTPHEPSFLSLQPPRRLAPVPITKTDGANPDPSPRLWGRQKKQRLTRGEGVCMILCVGRQEGERRRVLLCHHGNTSPCLLWTSFSPARGPQMKTNTGNSAAGPKGPCFCRLNCARHIFAVIIWQRLCSMFMWREDSNVQEIQNSKYRKYHLKETENHKKTDLKNSEGERAPQSKVLGKFFWTPRFILKLRLPFPSDLCHLSKKNCNRLSKILAFLFANQHVGGYFYSKKDNFFYWAFQNWIKQRKLFPNSKKKTHGTPVRAFLGEHKCLYLSCNVLLCASRDWSNMCFVAKHLQLFDFLKGGLSSNLPTDQHWD